ncbi:MAG: glycosyltransferase family 2 protein [archaeon]|nr:glycosyltransferase family 2 protein [archaeon]
MLNRIPYNILSRTIVVIPALNEGRNVGNIVKGILHTFTGIGVVVVDDGSVDKTYEIAKQSGATVLSLSDNMGYGVALQTGYKYAYKKKYQYVVQLDADGQHNYQDIGKLLNPVINHEADLVIGSRFMADGNNYQISFTRKAGINFFRILVFLLTGKKIKDVTSGLQAFNHNVLERYLLDDLPYYYPDGDVLILLLKGGYSIKEVPSAMNANSENKSMHNGAGQQVYYMITMILSILIKVTRELGRKLWQQDK